MGETEERSIYRPRTEDDMSRRKEWVDLDGGSLCVWEMTVRENMTVIERSQRPSRDPRGGLDRSEQMLWQIVMSCFDGDGKNAKLVFSPTDPGPVFRLRMKEYVKIITAIGRVNGADEADLKDLEAFIEARPGASTRP
jgi:hypothetical protein